MFFTFLIYCKSLIDKHLGDEFDYVYELPDTPNSLTADEHLLIIRQVIRSAWYDYDNNVQITIECTNEWNSMIKNLLETMEVEEGIRIG
jgi:hypothetical protein